MNEVVFLDTSPLGLACAPKSDKAPERDQCVQWLKSLRDAGKIIVVPEIADYELRRKLIHMNRKTGGQWARHLEKLDALKATHEYLPLTTEMMLKAAELWADPRGSPKTGHTWSPENRPMRLVARDVDADERPCSLRRYEQRIERRKKTTDSCTGTAGMVVAAD